MDKRVEEVKEKIAEQLNEFCADCQYRDTCKCEVGQICEKQKDDASQIFSLLHSAGYKSPSEVEEIMRVSLEDISEMSHFGVVRDWTLKLKNGNKIELGADLVAEIVKHENSEKV